MTNLFKEISAELMNISICIAIAENDLVSEFLDYEDKTLSDLIKSVNPIKALNLTNSIYYHYSNFINEVSGLVSHESYQELKETERKAYHKTVKIIESTIKH